MLFKLTNSVSIVFSAWKKTLDLVSKLCDAKAVTYVRIDGTKSAKERLQALDEFANNPAVSTLLMTLGTGAVGYDVWLPYSRVHTLTVILQVEPYGSISHSYTRAAVEPVRRSASCRSGQSSWPRETSYSDSLHCGEQCGSGKLTSRNFVYIH